MNAGTSRLSAEMTVEDLLDQFPNSAPVFVGHRMQCVGCPLARFETLAEACAIYRMDVEQFVSEINALAGGDPATRAYRSMELDAEASQRPFREYDEER